MSAHDVRTDQQAQQNGIGGRLQGGLGPRGVGRERWAQEDFAGPAAEAVRLVQAGRAPARHRPPAAPHVRMHVRTLARTHARTHTGAAYVRVLVAAN